MDLSLQQQWMLQNWGEVTTEVNASLRQVHYTVKLFQLVRDPVEVNILIQANCSTGKKLIITFPIN